MSSKIYDRLMFRANYFAHRTGWHTSQEDAEAELTDIVWELEEIELDPNSIVWEEYHDNCHEDYTERYDV